MASASFLCFYQPAEAIEAVAIPADWEITNPKIDDLVVRSVRHLVTGDSSSPNVLAGSGKRASRNGKNSDSQLPPMIVECIGARADVKPDMSVGEASSVGGFFVVHPVTPVQPNTGTAGDAAIEESSSTQTGDVNEELAKSRKSVQTAERRHQDELSALRKQQASETAALRKQLIEARQQVPPPPTTDSGGGSGGGSSGGGDAQREIARLQKINENLQDVVNGRGKKLKELQELTRQGKLMLAEKDKAIEAASAKLERMQALMVKAKQDVTSYWQAQVEAACGRLQTVADKGPSSARKALGAEQTALRSAFQAFVAASEKAAAAAAADDDSSEYETDSDEDGDGAAPAARPSIQLVKPDPAAAASLRKSTTVRAVSAKPAKLPEDVGEVVQKMTEIWRKPMTKTAVFKDLCRLARRIELKHKNKIVYPAGKEGPPLQVLADLIAEVAKRLESNKQGKLIAQGCQAFGKSDSQQSPEVLLQNLFQGVVKETSKTATLFRCIHQGLVMPCTFWLKAHTRILSKDVTSADGWRMTIDLDNRCVTHFRKEQSLSTAPAENFVLEYRLRFFLNKNMNDLTSADVRFSEVICDQDALADDVKDALKVLHEWNSHVAF